MNNIYQKLIIGMTLCFVALGNQAIAVELKAMDKHVSITVREQPVQQFLDTLFSQVNVPVVVSEEIQGLMNGKFDGSARQVFKDVANAFNVTMYFDGVVAHVYGANEITRTLLPVSNSVAERVEKIASRMQIGDRNNRVDSSVGGGLMVTGTRRFMEQIEEVSFSVQSNTSVAIEQKSPLAYRVFYLSNGWAADTSFNVGGQSVTIPGVATLLNQLVNDGRLPSSMLDRAKSQPSRSLNGLRGSGLQAVAAEAGNSANDSEATAGAASGSISNGARIVADSRLNAIIIRDRADRMPAYQELIKDLDKASEMVEIEATIVDINTDKTRDLGVGWDYLRSDGAASVIGGAGASSGSVRPSSQVSGPGAILSMALGGREQFMARVRALEEKGAAKVVSKPHVVTLSDVEAVLGATTEFFVRVAGDQEVDLFNVPVGTTLRVTPHVFQESGQARVKLLVNIEDGAASAETVDQIPVIERANINTQAVINEGDSLLIGGLVRDSYKQVSSGVPVLGSIPVLGRLFSSTSNQSSRVQRLFMITPRTSSGLGFGRAHNGKRSLPVLQGQPADIEAYAAERSRPPSQPFGKRVNEIPFAPLSLPNPTAPSMMPIDRPSATWPNKQSAPVEPASFNKWVAVSGSEPKSQPVTPVVVNKQDPSRWNSVPVNQSDNSGTSDSNMRTTSDGWTVVE